MSGAFDRWYDTAGVRAGTRRMFADETDQGKVFYPQDQVPYLAHEALGCLTDEQRRVLTIRHLYQFLLSTTHLETRVVNTTAERIANNRAGFDLPNQARMDAFKVYCDEGYHALYSLDLADQIAADTGVAIPPWDFGGFVDRLEEVGARLMPDEPSLVPLLQTVVFETLITAVLNEIPNDRTVMTVVRDLTRDHAKDEGHHHRFFAGFFHDLWVNLEPRLHEPVAHTLPAMVQACLTWDTEPIRASLLMSGVDGGTAAAVVADTYERSGSNADICRATVRTFRSAGVLDVPGAEEAFAAHQLL
ncbi:diiron oxygenase [Actinophytocola oryzae]|uniref:Para-aminobenzoate N-oxygenase AurF n=1 Tax=Actinophytocola oryzae TaxID=502181 RepID=A0A4R7UWE1_9PSEU|nr:diiron oxygenase [Actinophytocola oryzae]TDV41103.1 para-aminobenzoate N-oxygenase AurF [Actinophytocola oryzae]